MKAQLIKGERRAGEMASAVRKAAAYREEEMKISDGIGVMAQYEMAASMWRNHRMKNNMAA